MATLRTIYAADTVHPRDADLRWPASAIWRPGEPAVRSIELEDVKEALAQGIDDFRAMPSHALFLCIIYPVLGFVLMRLAFGYDILPLVYPLLTGMALLGPLAAVALYDISRRREMGLDASVWQLGEVFHSPSIGAIARLGLLLLAIFVIWLGVAQLMYVQIFRAAEPTSFGEFAYDVLATPQGHKLIIVGNGGRVPVRAFSARDQRRVLPHARRPRRQRRHGGAHLGARGHREPADHGAVGHHRRGGADRRALSFFIGLAVVVPILGHATWHLYRKVVSGDEAI